MVGWREGEFYPVLINLSWWCVGWLKGSGDVIYLLSSFFLCCIGFPISVQLMSKSCDHLAPHTIQLARDRKIRRAQRLTELGLGPDSRTCDWRWERGAGVWCGPGPPGDPIFSIFCLTLSISLINLLFANLSVIRHNTSSSFLWRPNLFLRKIFKEESLRKKN